MAALAADVRAACKAAGLDDLATMDLELAIVEAANNIVLHGYAGAKDAHYQAVIESREGHVEVTLSDRGRPIPLARLNGNPDMPCDGEGGRGIGLIKACVDQFEYASSGGVNRLILRRHVSR